MFPSWLCSLARTVIASQFDLQRVDAINSKSPSAAFHPELGNEFEVASMTSLVTATGFPPRQDEPEKVD